MGSTFELTVQRATTAGVWPVVAEYQRGGQLLPVRSEDELRLPAEPASASPRIYGEALGRALFSGSIRDAYVSARGDAPVRVWLCVEDAALRTWRWEWLCGPVDSTAWDFLSLDQRALYSLYLPSVADRPYPPLGRRDLRALVLVANPSDPSGDYGMTTFDARAAVSRLQAVFTGRLSYEVLARLPEAIGPPTLDGLVTQLTTGAAEGPYSLLHLVCHGRFDCEADETWIYLEQPAADATEAVCAQAVAATTLIERLRRVRQLPYFVFLSVCESGAPEAEQRLGGLAQRLVRELGIPAVIGMTEPVTIATAHALSEAFYTRLLHSSVETIGAVDSALVEAYAGLASRLDVHVPALYSRLGNQPLFSLAVDRELTADEIYAGLAQLGDLLAERAPVLQSDVAKHQQAVEPWLAMDPTALTADARQIRETSLQAFNEICQKAVDISFHALVQGTAVPPYDARQPFRGLSPFRAEDREFFFGRDAVIDTLLRKFSDDRFLPVLGPSGSGKSSLVLAGLIPRIQHQQPNLQVAYLTPGSTPLEQLHAIQATVGDGPVLYVVDQFEEVFTACRDEVQRRAFIGAVLALSTDDRVVVTMRADFWGECAPYPQLRARMQARQELIAPMTTAELRSAMEQQAAKVGLRFEADLSQTILDEVADEPGAMPLLQHALLELWNRRHGRWLRAAEYRAIGAVKQAIAQTADRLYSELSAPEQDRMRDIFLRLTQLDEQTTSGEERRDSRRRVPFRELVPAGAGPGATKRLIKRFADAVLVTTSHNPLTQQDEVEVAHEALIRHWTKLNDWLTDDLVNLRLRNSLTRAAAEWNAHPDDEALVLHRGARLLAVDALRDNPRFSFSEQELRYIDACIALRDTERLRHKLEEQQRRELQDARQALRVLSQRAGPLLEVAIGLLAVALPPILLLIGGAGAVNSISAYYYTAGRDWFTGTLWVIGMLLIVYPPQQPELAKSRSATLRSDRAGAYLGKCAGVSTILMTLLPATPPSGLTEPHILGVAHGASALVTFASWSLFPLLLFSRSSGPARAFYRLFGWLSLTCLALIMVNDLSTEALRDVLAPWRPVLWLEGTIIWAFGWSWLARGHESLRRHRRRPSEA
jgi:energy-coupling factor transporter ATP-binding protein EcfA2